MPRPCCERWRTPETGSIWWLRIPIFLIIHISGCWLEAGRNRLTALNCAWSACALRGGALTMWFTPSMTPCFLRRACAAGKKSRLSTMPPDALAERPTSGLPAFGGFFQSTSCVWRTRCWNVPTRSFLFVLPSRPSCMVWIGIPQSCNWRIFLFSRSMRNRILGKNLHCPNRSTSTRGRWWFVASSPIPPWGSASYSWRHARWSMPCRMLSFSLMGSGTNRR